MPHFATDIRFNGSNWQDLTRLVTLCKLYFLQDSEYTDDHNARCALLAACFEGPALDWVVEKTGTNYAIFSTFEAFVTSTREAFGVADNNITAYVRRELDQLQWNDNVPVFFSEFDRLTSALNITSHETRVAMVMQKLPLRMKQLLAQQALSFANYDTMRERFNCMWAMDPTSGKTVTLGKQKPRCGSCGKKGHVASNCRTKNE